MSDSNHNDIPDEVEIAAAHANEAAAKARRAEMELERDRLTLAQPLYDRIVMRLVIPFCLAFAAPVATYYFGTKVNENNEVNHRLERAVERLERLVVESEIRSRLRQSHAAPSSGLEPPMLLDPRPASATLDPDKLADDYLKHAQQVQEGPPADLDKFLREREALLQKEKKSQ